MSALPADRAPDMLGEAVLQVWTLAPPASTGTLARWADVAPPLRALHDTWTQVAA